MTVALSTAAGPCTDTCMWKLEESLCTAHEQHARGMSKHVPTRWSPIFSPLCVSWFPLCVYHIAPANRVHLIPWLTPSTVIIQTTRRLAFVDNVDSHWVRDQGPTTPQHRTSNRFGQCLKTRSKFSGCFENLLQTPELPPSSVYQGLHQ